MSKYPQINFNLNMIFLGFTDKASEFIKKELTRLPSDTSYIVDRNHSDIEIHLGKWMGKNTSYIYREVFKEIKYGDKKILAAYLQLEHDNTICDLYAWIRVREILNSDNARLTIDPEIGTYFIKEKINKEKLY